jgi:cellulose synthase/poly-beta-1,6-N-acetylglucosamine synthase-like glycosyltransferase
MMILNVYAVSITIAWIAASIYLLINSAKITFLKNVQISPDFSEPSVAIIIAVRNEEAEVEKALQSVCNLDYKNLEIVVINDRSTDRTAEILQRMTATNPAISVITISNLPKGWLGKNHALFQGYSCTSKEWLLFTDADILYNCTALKKAMQYAVNKRLDHLTALPEITSSSSIFKSVMNTFAMMLEIRLRPWQVSNPSSKASIGVGAFNLVKRTAYKQAGTHTVISLRPDDDLKLGGLIKKAHLRQDVVYGEKEISLDWYPSLAEFVKGLMKNTFSVANYHLPTAIGMAAATAIVFVLPIPVLLFLGQAGVLMAVVILLSQILLMVYKKGIHGRWWHAVAIPFSGAVMIYIIIKSAFKTLQQGGIYWRDSFYSLKELKKQK